MNNSPQDKYMLTDQEKVGLALQVGRGEYRLQDAEVAVLHESGCVIVREILTMYSKGNEDVIAHQRLQQDLGIDRVRFENVRNVLDMKYGLDLPQDLNNTLTVWDCYDIVDQQLSEQYIEAGINAVEENLTAGKDVQKSLDKAARLGRLARLAFYEEHELSARSLYWHGTALVMLGKAEKAMDYFEESLEIRKELHGPRDLRVASTLHNIAVTLDQIGEYEKSEACFCEAISICDDQLGENHPDVQLISKNLATMLQHAGRTEEAISILEKALAISEQSLGHEHRQTATTLATLATVLADQGELDMAEERLRESLNICSSLLGSDSLQAIAIRNNLAIVLSRKGDNERALSIMEKAVIDCVSRLGQAHPSTIAVRNNKAVLSDKLSSGENEEEWQELDRIAKKFSADDPIRNAVLNRQFISLPIAA